MADDLNEFELLCSAEVQILGQSYEMQNLTRSWFYAANARKYSYHFKALGLPIIQYPQDAFAVQEIVWATRPTLIIETGVARGGSVIWSAGLLALLDYSDAARGSGQLDALNQHRRVIGIDIDIRDHNRAAIVAHPLGHKIDLIQGSSIDPKVIDEVYKKISETDRVMVMLDSNHTHEHVLMELQAYARCVTPENFCIVFDTVIDDLPKDSFVDRAWNVGNSPKTAVRQYLEDLNKMRHLGRDGEVLAFTCEHAIENKLQITVAPGGYLRRVSRAAS